MDLEKAIATTKFMQTLSDDVISLLMAKAMIRGIGLQEMIRSVVVPEWLGVAEEPKTERLTLDQMLKSHR